MHFQFINHLLSPRPQLSHVSFTARKGIIPQMEAPAPPWAEAPVHPWAFAESPKFREDFFFQPVKANGTKVYKCRHCKKTGVAQNDRLIFHIAGFSSFSSFCGALPHPVA